jgi:hypothetical protein
MSLYDEQISDALTLIALQGERNRLEAEAAKHALVLEDSSEGQFLKNQLNPVIRSITDKLLAEYKTYESN